MAFYLYSKFPLEGSQIELPHSSSTSVLISLCKDDIIAIYINIFQNHVCMTQLLLLGKFEYTGGPIFKVVLEC